MATCRPKITNAQAQVTSGKNTPIMVGAGVILKTVGTKVGVIDNGLGG